MDGVSSYIHISGIISEESAINYEVVERSRVYIKQDSPVSIESDIVSSFGHCGVGPLSSIAP